MVDLDAAIGYVVAHGDDVDRARLSWLVSGTAPPRGVLDIAETGQFAEGGWPAFAGAEVPSVDATCFRLAELDDLGALDRPAARQAVGWLAGRQRLDGTWEEDGSLADSAPHWARPGDPEARLYLTACAGFWLTVAAGGDDGYAAAAVRAAEAFRASLRPDGSWPSFLVTGWLGAAMLHHVGWFYESAQIQVLLSHRVPEMSAGDCAAMVAALRRVGVSPDDPLLVAARRRLAETQRSDGGWPSADGAAFDVHTTLVGIRALRA
ncbi:prenyltransferase/squalene oxidase repeat-containing protein [Planosporangium sp. 12N6]|uniref:prenyltransferase/squalene oxidase repeat-containing protein n=1 Tax=Planosporangium spinosum TaxID=3402278 RepID=UPI003CE8E329